MPHRLRGTVAACPATVMTTTLESQLTAGVEEPSCSHASSFLETLRPVELAGVSNSASEGSRSARGSGAVPASGCGSSSMASAPGAGLTARSMGASSNSKFNRCFLENFLRICHSLTILSCF
ncbi:uncharacterized protein PV06_11652 [Exophiala oligosperma]|uniref:Uncharacterized protein n=1 Tax=Exophiala oligosperma TaxID=215243 RepID=A0A0D2DK24_9EURO|nr:uncharacterized protein PV06_11652 [Exophiala oligosperma]KIW36044.1 hypothetical protein PV06_11652 [Exophiala oligosperma]